MPTASFKNDVEARGKIDILPQKSEKMPLIITRFFQKNEIFPPPVLDFFQPPRRRCEKIQKKTLSVFGLFDV